MKLWHGADYNPDQWLASPDVLEEDMRLMKLAGCYVASVGIFAWSALEPRDGVYQFDWMDRVLDRLAENGLYALLATPSAAKPAWLSKAYPEIRRMSVEGVREPHRRRHNHCRTSPVYRDYCARINSELAKRYGNHPAILLWHVSNEYNGVDCHCSLCHAAFRTWLQKRYNHDLDALNHAWWTAFWSHTYADWEEIEPVDPSIHGLMLDWDRFKSDQTLDFFKSEIEPLRRYAPDIPVTTNFMEFHDSLDYWRFAKEVDVISWDTYPAYHDLPEDWLQAVHFSFVADMMRSFKQKPFIIMECTPGTQNHKAINKLKRPGVLLLEAMQYVAHGADSVQYFQWRKSRGGTEKVHGAVVSHAGHEHTRVFKEVAEVGKALASLEPVAGTRTQAEVAILFDWENRWAIHHLSGYARDHKEYIQTVTEHYRPFWNAGVACDVVNEDSPFDGYRLLVAPMMYMLRPGVAERIAEFVRRGGVLVTTYLSGLVDEHDLCFLNGFPEPFRSVLGIRVEETDTLYPQERVVIQAATGEPVGLSGDYEARTFCDLIHCDEAQACALYGSEFYTGRPAMTVNQYGKGRAYYMASRNDMRFHTDFYRALIHDLDLPRVLDVDLPNGISAQMRRDGNKDYIFILGFNREPIEISLGDHSYRDLLNHIDVAGSLNLPPYSVRVLERKTR